jgi:hypothetical protein
VYGYGALAIRTGGKGQIGERRSDTSWEPQTGIVPAAIGDAALLLAIAEHKSIFFPTASAWCEQAKPGSMRLVPLGA